MKPLFVLLGAFIISLPATKFLTGEFDYSLSGRIAMSSMLLFTAIGHFALTKGMTLMMPDFIPFKKELVYFTGVVEIAAAAGLLISSLQNLTAWLLILFLILVLPVNINAARKKIDYQKGTTNGNGIKYLWFRVPVQLFFIVWVYFFALKGR
jgi:uncharacterized membrane protein